jgi:type IV pilus assembly protein PilX
VTGAPRTRAIRAGARRQRGAALLIALLLLSLMLGLGSTALDSANVDQRLAANLRDRAAAFEGAEAGALHALAHLRWLTATGRGQPDDSAGYYRGGALPRDGAITSEDSAAARFWADWRMDEDNSRASGLGSGLAGAAPGRYLIERLAVDDEGEPADAASYPLSFSRITVWGPGGNGANVLLQAIYVGVPE